MPPTTLPGLKLVSSMTDEEKYLQQQQVEQEFNRMRREYLILDGDRTRIQLYGNSKLCKSNRVFNIFKNEYLNILTDLSVAKAPEKKREDAKMFDQLNLHLVHYGLYNKGVKAEKNYMVELEEKIKEVKKSVENMRKLQVTDRQLQERHSNAVKTYETLENKLEVQVHKFNLICTRNREMREEIDHLLWDRRNFMTMWDRLIEKLVTGKKIMLDLIEQATLAYDQRETWCDRLQMLRTGAHNDLLLNIERMREMKRKEDHGKKLEDFFIIKGQKRIMKDLKEREKQKRAKLKEKLQQKLLHYENMMLDIMEFTKEKEAEIIAKRFYKQEADNFTHFKYVSDLIEEMETNGDRLGYLHIDIEEQKAQHHLRSKDQQEKIKSLEVELKKAQAATEASQNNLDLLDSKFSNIMHGVSNLFRICKCSSDPLIGLLGNQTTVQPYNILLYLEILEKKVLEYLIKGSLKDKVMSLKKGSGQYQRVLTAESKIRTQIFPIEKIVSTNPCALCVELEMVGDVIDSLQIVWSRKMVKNKLRQKLALPDGHIHLHNISRCHLPKARRLMQKRYE